MAKSPNYLKEAGYLASISAINAALKNFTAQNKAETGRYDIDYKTGLRDLGYRDTNINDSKPGTWDWSDMLTASGRGHQGNATDFAGRGMLQSSGYGDAQNNLNRSLEQQRGAMSTARQGFRAQQKEAATAYNTQAKSAKNLAKVSAIDRLANQLALY